MSRPTALVTGAGGEMGHLLVPELARRGFDVVALDLVDLPDEVAGHCVETLTASILDVERVAALIRRRRPARIFHLAAVLSSKAERDPDLAHRVNVDGTWGLFRLCGELAGEGGDPIRFLFPSSIAVYGLPDADTKRAAGAVRETEWTVPAGIYGCNKLYCELLGTRLTREASWGLDFRSIRFPGLISADTLPTGGTTDYAPLMIHAAARGEAYDCFVREDARLPFMTMPDAVDALLTLADADPARLSTRVYNIRAFSPSAGEIADAVRRRFPSARIGFDPVPHRQAIVDSWPADVDDSLARRDWGLAPRHDFESAMGDYLVPGLLRRVEAGS